MVNFSTVTVGKVLLGSAHPVAKQTMTTTNTRDVEASVAQVLLDIGDFLERCWINHFSYIYYVDSEDLERGRRLGTHDCAGAL
jgi:hypothetical protein